MRRAHLTAAAAVVGLWAPLLAQDAEQTFEAAFGAA